MSHLFNFENVSGVGKTPEGVDYIVASGEEESEAVFLYPRSFSVGILNPETSETRGPVLTLNLESVSHPCYSCQEVHDYDNPLVIAMVPQIAKAVVSLMNSIWPEWQEFLEELGESDDL